MLIRNTALLKIVYFVLAACTASVYPSPESNPKPAHDVAITNVSVPSSCVAGDAVPVTVSVANQGVNKEAFRVTLTDSTSGIEIASKEVSLEQVLVHPTEDLADCVFDADEKAPNHYGWFVSSGHINDDEYEDIACSAPYYGNNKGRAYVYFGRKKFDTIPDIVITAEEENMRLGVGFTVCDLNNDGFDDLVVGSPWYHSYQGRVYVYYGGKQMDTVPDKIFDTKQNGELFGRIVNAGHVNNDNHLDLLVTALRHDGNTGKCLLYYGGYDIDTNPDKTFYGENGGDNFGRDTTLGDIDGDGFDDVIVGARDYDGNSTNIGRVYLFWGAPGTSMDNTVDLVFTGENGGDEFGSTVKSFDVDGDGADELLIGARYWNKGISRLYLWWGGSRSVDPTKADLMFTGKGYNVGDGVDVGYFNNDKYIDILTGGHPGRDSAVVFYGSDRRFMDNIADLVFTPAVHSTFGAFACAANLNNDGYDEIIISDHTYPDAVSRQGRLYLFFGPFDTSTDITFKWDTTNASPGKHTLKATIAPVAGEEDAADNSVTVTVDVKEKRQWNR